MPDPHPPPDHPGIRRVRRIGCIAALALGLLAAGVPWAGWLALRGSLPPLEGRRALAGLSAAVTVERDANGVPTVHAANKEDAFRALGHLHAQDRFFQMDLLRRQAAGELAGLFGAAALPTDRATRVHRFRWRAAEAVARLDPEQGRWLAAYTAGVNAGLDGLRVRPWEYLVLRAAPKPWRPEDTLLAVDAMALSLQEHDGLDERLRLAILETYGPEVLAFLKPSVREATAALDGSSQPAPPVPDASHFLPLAGERGTAGDPGERGDAGEHSDVETVFGSNNFALAGNRVAGGGAMVANDMHLGLMVPNTWYRSALVLPGRTVVGVTLPGVPGIVAGSNGDVAWGFTDAYIDAADVVVVETDPGDPSRYRVPDGTGWERFETVRETLEVAGGRAETLDVVSTRWGPLLTKADAARRTLALRWVATDPGAANLGMCRLADVRTVDEAVELAHRVGIPAENFVVGDRAGNIAWTIIGPVPGRVGFDGQTPRSWADGTRRWDGWLPPGQIPVVRNPPDGQLWTANNRVVGGDALARLGNGGYDEEARAAQIRDRLRALAGRAAKPADALAVQLDDESIFLARWRDLLLRILTDDAVEKEPPLNELREAVREWHGHAAVKEAGHRLVREFRRIVTESVMNPLYEPVRRHAPDLEISRTTFRGVEQPLWSIVTARPAWLLPASAPSWDALLLRAATMTARLGDHLPDGPALRDCTWGQRNILHMSHPFSRLLPEGIAQRWLDMPARPLPGDNFMPRVQTPDFGASERMAVVPGREAEGIFHQPGGASGHFLSPFYRAGHDDWSHGRPSPFLPGAAKYRLELDP